jgi:hypothetical protein
MAALGLLSAGQLCFEAARLRLYAVQQFYHSAILANCPAVLGIGRVGWASPLNGDNRGRL